MAVVKEDRGMEAKVVVMASSWDWVAVVVRLEGG